MNVVLYIKDQLEIHGIAVTPRQLEILVREFKRDKREMGIGVAKAVLDAWIEQYRDSLVNS